MLHSRAPTDVLLRGQVARQAAPYQVPRAGQGCEFPICGGLPGFLELISLHLNVERWTLSVGRFPPLYLTNQSASCAQLKTKVEICSSEQFYPSFAGRHPIGYSRAHAAPRCQVENR